MANYIFAGYAERFYPNIMTVHGSLVAAPGDVMEFDNPPTDGLWHITDEPVTEIPFRQWPPAYGQPAPEAEAVSEPAPEPTPAPVYPTIF